jgi:hypothetical protein
MNYPMNSIQQAAEKRYPDNIEDGIYPVTDRITYIADVTHYLEYLKEKGRNNSKDLRQEREQALIELTQMGEPSPAKTTPTDPVLATYKVGDRVRVVSNDATWHMHGGHGFSLGEEVEITDVRSKDYTCKGVVRRISWWVASADIEPLTDHESGEMPPVTDHDSDYDGNNQQTPEEIAAELYPHLPNEDADLATWQYNARSYDQRAAWLSRQGEIDELKNSLQAAYETADNWMRTSEDLSEGIHALRDLLAAKEKECEELKAENAKLRGQITDLEMALQNL